MSGYPTSTSIPWVDGLSMDTPVLGRHKFRLQKYTVMTSLNPKKIDLYVGYLVKYGFFFSIFTLSTYLKRYNLKNIR